MLSPSAALLRLESSSAMVDRRALAVAAEEASEQQRESKPSSWMMTVEVATEAGVYWLRRLVVWPQARDGHEQTAGVFRPSWGTLEINKKQNNKIYHPRKS